LAAETQVASHANLGFSNRIYENEDLFAAIDARTESLQNLRELGPPDLVYLVKQTKTNPNRQVRSTYLFPSSEDCAADNMDK